MRPMTMVGTVTLPGEVRSARRARRFVRDTIGADHPAVDDAELCVGELVANAVTHSRSGGEVAVIVALGEDAVQVCVIDDGSDDVPRVRDDLPAEHGRGLLVVRELAAEWGADATDVGTATWCRIRH